MSTGVQVVSKMSGTYGRNSSTGSSFMTAIVLVELPFYEGIGIAISRRSSVCSLYEHVYPNSVYIVWVAHEFAYSLFILNSNDCIVHAVAKVSRSSSTLDNN
jgi:hypothetical protein